MVRTIIFIIGIFFSSFCIAEDKCKDGKCPAKDPPVLQIIGNSPCLPNTLVKLSLSSSQDAVIWTFPAEADTLLSPDKQSVTLAISSGTWSIQAVTGKLVDGKIQLNNLKYQLIVATPPTPTPVNPPDPPASTYTLLEFGFPQCIPCQQMKTVFDDLGKKYKLTTSDTTKETLFQKYQITQVPTIIVQKDGKEIGRKVGVVAEQDILDLMK